MRVTLQCGADDLTIWLPSRTAIVPRPIRGTRANCRLLFAENDVLRGVAFDSDLLALCPYEMAKVVSASAGSDIQTDLQSKFDPSVDMGYIYLDKRSSFGGVFA